MKRLLAVCLSAVLLLGAFPVAMIGSVSAAESTWTKKESVITTPWYDEITADTIPLDEYPNPQLEREDWLNLNGLWNFAGSATEVDEPGSYNQQILVPYAMESALSGIMQHYDYAWYNREFTIPADWNADDRIILHFEAVDWLCSVYVNGEEVVEHKGGYLPFSVDVTDALRSGTNTLSVKVFDNTDSEGMTNGKQRQNAGGIFYTSVSGIWGTVWMEPVSAKAYVADTLVTTDIDTGVIGLTVNKAGDAAATVDVTVKAEDQIVAEVTGLAMDKANDITIPEDQLYLWSPETPFLYDLLIEVKVDGEVVDTVKSYVGMRKVALVDTGKSDENGAIKMMYLNDEPIYQNGFLDQGYWPDSLYTAPTDEALRWDIQAQKDLGYNMIRKHIKIESRRWYYYADKIGMIVWQDQPCGADAGIAFEDFKAETFEMVETLRNHPSIAVWIIYNEGWRQHDQGGAKTREITNDVKALDPTRLVTPASGWFDAEAGDISDTHHYPDPWPGLSGTRARVCGEFGGLTYVVQDHLWKGQDAGYTADFESPERLLAGYKDLMAQCKNYKNSIGMSAQVYTQFTDLEGEINGIYTYDRKVLKVDEEEMFEVNQEMIRDGVIFKGGLEAAIDRVALKDTDLYSEASWAIVDSAMAEAQVVLDDEDATQYQIYQATQSLLTALDELYALGSTAADKTALNVAIRDADARDARDYTAASVQALPAALAAAKAVKSRSNATQDEVDAAAEALQAVLDELEYLPADKAALNAAVAQAEALDEFDHQPLTWQPLAKALAKAQAVKADADAKVGAILDATEALEEALAGLKRFDEVKATRYEAEYSTIGTGVVIKSDTFFSNKGAVEGLSVIASIGSASDVASDWSNVRYVQFMVDAPVAGEYQLDIIYCTNTGANIYIRANSGDTVPVRLQPGMLWNSMVTNTQTITLNKGPNVIWLSGATSTDTSSGDWINLDCVDLTLKTATGDPDKAALKEAIDAANALQEDGYTAASWDNLQLTLTAAQKGYDNANATVMQVEGLRQAVLAAIEALEDKPAPADKAALQAAIAAAEALNEDEYTESSWAKLAAALADARTADITGDVTQETVDAAAKALNDAIKALEKTTTVTKGDVNADGAVDSKDARLVLQYAVDAVELTAAQQEAANVVEDNAVDSKDARAILQIAVA